MKLSESYSGYVYRVHAMGKKGRVNEQTIITYARNGLCRDPLYNSLITVHHRDIYELVNFIKRCETHLLLRRNSSSLHANPPKLAATSTLDKVPATTEVQPRWMLCDATIVRNLDILRAPASDQIDHRVFYSMN